MSDERLIELAKMVLDEERLDEAGKTCQWRDALKVMRAKAAAIIDELEPEPREWRGSKPVVYKSAAIGGAWYAEVGRDSVDYVWVYGNSEPNAVRRLNAATRAIDEMEGVDHDRP